MAKIDVLLPYWGDVELFKSAVNSVLGQTEVDFRLLVVDDCYPSDEAKIFIESLKDDRVQYIRHEKNLGITKNFNFCIESATADYCMLLGCDDILLPNHLQMALSSIHDADFYQSGVDIIDGAGKSYLPIADKIKKLLRPKQPGQYSGEKLATSLAHGNWLYFPSIVWKTSSLKRYRFDDTYRVVEDYIVEMQLIADGGKLQLTNDVTFQYRRFSESVSSQEKKSGRFKEEAEAYKILEKLFISIGWRKAARASKLHITSRLHHLLSRIF